MGQTLRVLSVFESPRDGEAVRRLLDEAPPGFLVVDAGSREAFEAALAAGEFDAVLTDLGVLGFDGLSILDAVRARHPRVPVLVVSGVDSAERAVEAMKRGAADYILNTPAQLARLPEAIHAAAGRAERGEKLLRASEERFREAMDATSDGLWDWDIQTEQVYYSPAYFRILGYSPGELPAHVRTWVDLIHAEDKARALKANWDCIENRVPDFAVEFRMRAKSGEWKWILGRGRATSRDANGRALRMIGTHVDITERKRTEEALRQSEERFSKAFHASPASSTITRIRDRHLLEVNEAFERLTGYSREEAIGRTSLELRLWVDPKEREPIMPVLLSEGRVREREFRFRTKDGQQVIGQYSAALIEIGGEACYLATVVDITERKQAEEALRKSEELHREAQRVAHIGHWELVPGIGTPAWSDEVFRIFGLDPEQGAPSFAAHQNHLHPEDWDLLNDSVQKASTDGTPFDIEFRLLRPDGGIRWMHAVGTTTRDENAKVSRLFGTAQDITDLKRAETALHESEERYAQAARTAHLGHWERDHATGRAIWSPEALRVFGSLAEAPRRLEDFLQLVHPDDREAVDRAVKMALATGERYDVEYRILLSNGAERAIHAVGEVRPGANGLLSKLVGTLQDITDRRQAEEELRRSREQLRALAARIQTLREEERTLIAQEIHDELGHALTALKMDIAQCGKKTGSLLAPDARDALARRLKPISDSVDRMVEMVRRIATELRPAILDHLGLCPAIEWLAQQFQDRQGIRCRAWLRPAAIELAPRPTTELFRMVQELLTNVLRHARATEVDITLEQQGGSLRLEVRDDGIGITPEEAADAGSLGLLGLRERARLLGGEFAIAGSPGKGTTATVRIPLRAGQEEHNGNPHRG